MKKTETSTMIGQQAPNFQLPTDGDGQISLADLKGSMAVIYFYPKDDTPGCTTEALDFTARKADFDALGVKLIGVSKDTVAKHDKFKAKHGIEITLASDEAGEMIDAYGAWQEKSMYGKKYMGIVRSTVLISDQGKIIEHWPKVRVKGHVDAVYDAAKLAAS